MTKPAIVVKDVRKEFILPQSKNSSIKHAFVNIVKRNKKTAVRNILSKEGVLKKFHDSKYSK